MIAQFSSSEKKMDEIDTSYFCNSSTILFDACLSFTLETLTILEQILMEPTATEDLADIILALNKELLLLSDITPELIKRFDNLKCMGILTKAYSIFEHDFEGKKDVKRVIDIIACFVTVADHREKFSPVMDDIVKGDVLRVLRRKAVRSATNGIKAA